METFYRSRRVLPFIKILFAAIFLTLPCFAGVETVEFANVQLCKNLGGIVVVDQANSPLADVEVLEVTPDWKTVIRRTRTNAQGLWSLPEIPGKHIYFLRFITKECCFNEVRCKVKVNKHKGNQLQIGLPVST